MLKNQIDINNLDTDQISNIIQRYFSIQDVTTGIAENFWKMRFRGRLRGQDSETVYDILEKELSRHKLHPLFRIENNQQVIYLVDELPKPAASNPRINLILFILTLLSVWFTAGLLSLESLDDGFTPEVIRSILLDGWPFALSILTILGAHEMGHYIAGRIHKVNVTLPYFIPLPLISPFGTMGAFINMKSIPKNKKQLFDIGIAGPLAGLVVTIPVLFLGLSLSSVQPLPAAPGGGVGLQMEGNSIFYLLAKYVVFGQWLPQPASYQGMPPLLYWMQYFFTGQPFPYGGLDVIIHPVAWAGWAGLFVTSMNLIPVGQLDGGHIMSAVFGTKSRRVYNIMLAIMVLLGFGWRGWWFWAVLLFFLSRAPSMVNDEITQLDSRRKWLALMLLGIFILVFIPVPLILIV